MALIYQFPTPVPATVGVLPGQKFAIFGDNLATVTTAGYLNQASLVPAPLSTGDVVQAFYGYNLQTQVGTLATFSVSISGTGVITLSTAESGVVNAGTANQLAYYAATGSTVSGLTGAASATVVTNSSGVPAMTASMTNGQVLIGSTGATPTPATLTGGNAISVTNGAHAITLAYAPTRTNGTESGNAVTANGQIGVITTSSLSTIAGSSYAITWTNSSISSTSVILLSLMGGTDTTKDITIQAVAGSGSAVITIYNTASASALNGTLLIGYAVF